MVNLYNHHLTLIGIFILCYIGITPNVINVMFIHLFKFVVNMYIEQRMYRESGNYSPLVLITSGKSSSWSLCPSESISL